MKDNTLAVSEILGTILILAITVPFITSVYLVTSTMDSPDETPIVDIVGMTINNNDIVFSNQGGDELPVDAIIIFEIGGVQQNYKIGDLLDYNSSSDGYWNIGEDLVFTYDVRGLQVETRIVDPVSNAIVWQGILQEGEYIRDPTVFTKGSSNIDAVSATISLDYNFWGESGLVRFSYREEGGTWSTTPWIGKSGEDSYDTTITGLKDDTNYEYKAELNWDTFFVEGEILTFKTDKPTIVTLDASDIRTFEAKLWLQYDFKGTTGSVRFSYKVQGGSWIDTTWYDTSGQGTYSETVTGLIPESNYEFKAVITYNSKTDEGSSKYFSTWSIIMGIWHFSEGTGTTAHDTSGLNNHATLYGSEWTTGVNASAVRSDGINDYIRVFDVNSLDTTEQVTIEAWFKPLENSEYYEGEISNSVIDTSWFGPNYGRDPDIIQISGEVHCIAFRGDNDDGYLATFSVLSNGMIKNTIDYLEFDTSDCYEPDIIHIANNIYAIAYEGVDNDGYVVTVEIDNAGQITDTLEDSFEFDTSYTNQPRIFNVIGDIYAISYMGFGNDGFVTTVEISNLGVITNSIIDTTIFCSAEPGFSVSEPVLIHVGNDNYAVVFRNPDDDGEIRTIKILNDGTFTSPPHSDGNFDDKFVYDGYDGWWPSIKVTHINSNIYAIAYRAREGKGAVVTVDIDSNGVIQDDIIDKLYFDDVTCNEPDFVYISNNYYAVVYRGQGNDGYVKIVEIYGDGQINDVVIDTYEFDTVDCFKPAVYYYTNDIYLVPYSHNNEGFLKTLELTSTPSIAEVHFSRYCIFDFTNPSIVNVNNDIYAIASQGLSGDGYLRTIQISNTGQISNYVIDMLEFDLIDGHEPVIINVIGNIFAIVYRGVDNDGFIITVEILNDGSINGGTVIDTLEFDISNCFEPDIIHVNGQYFAIVYRGPDDDGFIKTVKILNDGHFDGGVIDTFEYDPNRALEPDILKVFDNIFSVVYQGNSGDGYISTVSILNNGDISNAVIDSYEFDTSYCWDPELINVHDNVYAIVYSYDYMGGRLATLEIDNTGIITKSIIDITRFDHRQPSGDDDCYTPQIIHIYDMVYAIVYRGEYNGYIKTLRIGDLGDISTVNDDYLLFDGNGYEPQIINVGGNIYAIPFRGSGSNAMIKTVEIIPQLVTSPRRVVDKHNAYGLKANATRVFGYINGVGISAPISSTDFNYVVLTYNRTLPSDQMKLYVDSVLITEYTYSNFINSNGYHLIMCQDYNCIIDEVTLWNVAISDSQILDNYNLYKP